MYQGYSLPSGRTTSPEDSGPIVKQLPQELWRAEKGREQADKGRNQAGL